jgi:integrase/recombinase XerD
MVAKTNGDVQETGRRVGHKKIKPAALAQVTAVFPGFDDLRGRLTPGTLYEYAHAAVQYLAFCQGDPPAAWDPGTLRTWRRWMVDHSEYSPYSINVRLAAVKSLIRASARMGALPASVDADFQLLENVSNNALKHRIKRPQTLLSPQEVRAICRAPDPSSLQGLRDRAFLLTLASSGCRISEVVSLQTHQIVRHKGRLLLEVWGKGQERERYALVSTEAYDWLQRWLRARDRLFESPWFFTAFWPCGRGQRRIPTGKPLSAAGASGVFMKHAVAAGVPHAHPHAFRKFVGTEVAERFGVRAAQRILGHKLLQTTEQFYVLDFDKHLAKVSDDLF